MRIFFSYIVILLCILGCNNDKDILNGYIEAEYQYIAPTSGGILSKINVQRGDKITAGTKLFSIEDLQLKIDIANAKAAIRQAEAALRENTNEYTRGQKLAKSNFISKADLDKKETDYDASMAELDIAKQNLIAAEKKLHDSAPYATEDAYVEDTFFIPGEFIKTGQAVVSLLMSKNIKVRFFIPENQVTTITEGQYITVLCDGCDKRINAKVTYISKQAEYTPPVIYSKDSRQKMVFMVEAKTDDVEPCLRPGLPVDIKVK